MQWALGSTSGKSKKTSKSDEQQGRSSDGSSHALGAGQQQKNNEGSLHWAGEQPAALHSDAHETEGGLACNNDELLRVQQKAITKWMKGMGQKLLAGNLNLINTPFPVDIFEPRSYLEKLADVWVYPRYLRQAAASSDPVERMKLVITWFIAGLHHSFEKWKKPFNPILGETWQAALSDGSTIFMEQISHHPPVSAFHIEGPGGCYRFVGLSEPTVSLLVMAGGFKTVAKGTRSVQFPDGTHIDITYPAYCMKGIANSTLGSFGIAKGKPRGIVEGTAVFNDAKHHLRAVVRFGSDKHASGPNKSILKRSDAVHGEIYDMGDLTEALCRLGVVATQESPKTASHGGDDTCDEDFESASETDWDMRDEGPSVGDGPSGCRDQHGGSNESLPGSRSFPSLSSTANNGDKLPPASTSSSSVIVTKHATTGSSMFGKFFGYPSSDMASPKGDEQQPLGKVVSRFRGSWLSYLDFDGVRLWSWEKEQPDCWQSVPRPLPSDCRFREDLQLLASGADLKAAQAAKEKLEHLQRNDKKLRELRHQA